MIQKIVKKVLGLGAQLNTGGVAYNLYINSDWVTYVFFCIF